METVVVAFLLILLLFVVIALIISLKSSGFQHLIRGGQEKSNHEFREICVEKIDNNSGDIPYVDEMYKENYTFSLRGKFFRDYKTNEQVQTIVRFGNVNEYARLINLLGKHISAPNFKRNEILKNLLYKKSDSEIYAELCKYFHRNEGQRSVKQAQDILRPLKRYLNENKINKIDRCLDVGCGNGQITAEVKNILNLSEINCVEVDKNLNNPEVKYEYLNSENKLPYPDEKFDLITAYMSLHHVENLNIMIKEMHRIMKPNGLLFIKEHDTWNAFDAMLVDIEHAIFITCNEGKEFIKYPYFCHYKNYWGWDKILGNYFQYQKADYFYSSIRNEISPTRAFWAIYKKI